MEQESDIEGAGASGNSSFRCFMCTESCALVNHWVAIYTPLQHTIAHAKQTHKMVLNI